MKSYYLYDASQLLQQSCNELQEIIEASEASRRSHHTLYDLREALLVTERQLHQHVHSILDSESRVFRNAAEQSLLSLVESLRLQEEKRKRTNQNTGTHHATDVPFVYYPTRNATDSLMFRLIVILQLCVVRIGDARITLTNIRKKDDSAFLQGRDSFVLAPLVLGTSWVLSKVPVRKLIAYSNKKLTSSRPRIFDHADWTAMASTLAQAGFAVASAYWLKQKWGMLWLTTKLAKTTADFELWNRQWFMVQSTLGVSRTNSNDAEDANAQDSTKSKRLIEYALKATPKV
jgi:hypothetical protein